MEDLVARDRQVNRVTFSFVGELRQRIGTGRAALVVSDEATVGDIPSILLDAYPCLAPYIQDGRSFSEGRLVLLVNGRNVALLEQETPLANGAKVVLTKPIGGG